MKNTNEKHQCVTFVDFKALRTLKIFFSSQAEKKTSLPKKSLSLLGSISFGVSFSFPSALLTSDRRETQTRPLVKHYTPDFQEPEARDGDADGSETWKTSFIQSDQEVKDFV